MQFISFKINRNLNDLGNAGNVCSSKIVKVRSRRVKLISLNEDMNMLAIPRVRRRQPSWGHEFENILGWGGGGGTGLRSAIAKVYSYKNTFIFAFPKHE